MNFIINYTVYPFDVMFSFGQTDKELVADLKKSNQVRTSDKTYKYEPGEEAKTVHYENGFTLVRLKSLPKTADDWGFLQHEIFHAAVFLMEYVGIKLAAESDESFAYIIGFLTKESYKRIMT